MSYLYILFYNRYDFIVVIYIRVVINSKINSRVVINSKFIKK